MRFRNSLMFHQTLFLPGKRIKIKSLMLILRLVLMGKKSNIQDKPKFQPDSITIHGPRLLYGNYQKVGV